MNESSRPPPEPQPAPGAVRLGERHAVSTFGQARQVLAWIWAHPANRQRRLRGVMRAVAFQLRSLLGHRMMTTIGRDGRMWVAPHERAASKALYANPPDWNEMSAWRLILTPGDLFVDVGSNVGTYALWAGDAGATVIAIEPNPAAAARLRENAALNDFPIIVVQCALAAAPGRMTLSRGRDCMNHLLFGAAPGVGDEIDVDTLDNVLRGRYAAGVKIDVEGAERLVLEGAEQALSQGRIGVLQLEWNGMSERILGEPRSRAADILLRHGYTFARPGPDGVLHAVDPWRPSPEDIFAFAPADPWSTRTVRVC